MFPLLRRLRARLKYRHLDRDLTQELDLHRAMKEDDLRAAGVEADDAHYRSMRALGNTTYMREEARLVRLGRVGLVLDQLRADTFDAARSLRRSPAFTAVSIVWRHSHLHRHRRPDRVTEAFAKQFFPGEDVLGKRISLGTEYDGSEPWREIVGVIGDVLQSPDGDGKSELFVPYEQHPDDFFSRMYQHITLAVRTAGEPASITTAFRAAVKHMDPNQPIVNLRTMTDVKNAAVTQPRFRTTLLGMFAVMALVLAGIGVDGLLGHGVAQRRGEFGVRLALGATAGQIAGLVIREGALLAVVGLSVGTVVAILSVRLVQSMLFGVTMWDAGAWIMSGVALVLVALIASWIPARRATHVAPSLALRE